MARPEIKVTKAMINKVEKLAAQGLTLEQIAHCLGMSYNCLNEKKKAYSELNDAHKRGKAAGIQKITNKLFNKALTGDNTAMIFYLKCRDREAWNENKQENSGASEIAEALSSIADNLPK